VKPLFAWLDERRETYVLGLARVVLSLMYAQHAVKLFKKTLDYGYFADVFYLPLVPEAWVPSRSLYLALLGLQILAAVLAALGRFARPSLLLASSIGLYLFCCNRLEYHNNRYVLHLMVFLLAFMPCDRSFRAFAPKLGAEQRVRPVWAQRLAQIQISLVYAASAGSKLVDPDWRGGQVLFLRYRNIVKWWFEHGYSMPDSVIAALGSPVFADVTSKAAIATELFVAFALWFGRTRAFALWLGVMLHFGIEVGANVEAFSYLMWASYLLFCVPELRQRKFFYDPTRAAGRAFAHMLRTLDWLARFQLAAATEPGRLRWGISAIDRNQREESGFGALVLMTRALPLLFPLWVPLFLLQKASRSRAARA
jgi:hypothetical protein